MGSYSPDSSITGATQSAFTTPTYTLAQDNAPPVLGSRQHVVTSIGGTQTNVRSSTAGDPFTVMVRKFPYRSLPARNPVTGLYGSIPRNKVEFTLRKGVKVDSAGLIVPMDIRIAVNVPAGSEINDAPNIRAAWCFLVGLLAEEAEDVAESTISGVW